jgi:RNA-directed DNA polymerase
MSGCWRGHHGLLRRDRPSGLLDRGCRRVADKRVLALVKAFPASSPRTAPGGTHHRHPTRGILSPLLSNVALSVLDEHAAEVWARDSATFTARQRRRRHGLANWRLVRDADDFVLVVSGTRAQAETLREEVAAVLAQVGLRLSEQKTRIAHSDEGFDFLGWRLQRQQQRGAVKRVVSPTRPRRP